MTKTEQEDPECIRRREKNFAVEIEPYRYADITSEFTLRITHNGYQWSGINLSPDEARKIISLLTSHLSTLP